MSQYTYRFLELDEIERIFDHNLYEHFPDAEIKPFWKIERLYNKGHYKVFVMEKDRDLYGYAFLIINHQDEIALLDYFAMNPKFRGQGIGSIFLKELRALIDVKGILIESEIPDEAKTEADRLVREKRIKFYLKNDAILTEYYWQHYGVGFNLLLLPCCGDCRFPDLKDAILNIASLSLSKEKLEEKTKLVLLSER